MRPGTMLIIILCSVCIMLWVANRRMQHDCPPPAKVQIESETDKRLTRI